MGPVFIGIIAGVLLGAPAITIGYLGDRRDRNRAAR